MASAKLEPLIVDVTDLFDETYCKTFLSHLETKTVTHTQEDDDEDDDDEDEDDDGTRQSITTMILVASKPEQSVYVSTAGDKWIVSPEGYALRVYPKVPLNLKFHHISVNDRNQPSAVVGVISERVGLKPVSGCFTGSSQLELLTKFLLTIPSYCS